VANENYLHDYVKFGCWITTCARTRGLPVNLIMTLKAVVGRSEGENLMERLEGFTREYKEASGIIVRTGEFKELMRVMRVGEKLAKVGNEGKR